MSANLGYRSKNDLDDLLAASERELGISLIIQDCHAVMRAQDGSSLLSPERLAHQPLSGCDSIPSKDCPEDCALAIDHRAQGERRPFVFSCGRQLIKLIIPIRSRGDYLATLVAGTWQPEAYDSEEWDAEELASWREATSFLPVFEPPRMERLSRILDGISIATAAVWEGSIAMAGHPMEATEIMRYIRANYWRHLKLDELADHVGISASHASHVVTGYFGQSFRELIRDERLSAAAMLLRTTDYLVGDISGRVGISDEQHFNRLFKKERGISPGRYRRSHS